METVFDFNLTEEEKRRLSLSEQTRESYIQEADEDRIALDLFYLLMGRGNYHKAKQYLALFKDRAYRSEIFRCYWGDIVPYDDYHKKMEIAYEIFKDII